MNRISIAYFYGVGAAMRPLRDLKPGKFDFDNWMVVYSAQQELESLLGTPWFIPAIKTSWNAGQQLIKALKDVASVQIMSEVTQGQIYAVTYALTEFETILRAELSIADAYFVTRKGGYDTSSLISNAEVIFPPDLGSKTPQAIPDIREAGKCLAYEISTAAGFHVLRAVETVIRRYWEVVSNGAPHPKQKNMGVYIKRMEDNSWGTAKVLSVLKQIKDLHRNPLSHPEITLNLHEAVGLFGIAQSAVGAMLAEIPVNPISAALSSAAPSS